MLIFAAEKSVSTLCKQHNVNYAADAFLDEKHNVNYVTVAVSGGFFYCLFYMMRCIFSIRLRCSFSVVMI